MVLHHNTMWLFTLASPLPATKLVEGELSLASFKTSPALFPIFVILISSDSDPQRKGHGRLPSPTSSRCQYAVSIAGKSGSNNNLVLHSGASAIEYYYSTNSCTTIRRVFVRMIHYCNPNRNLFPLYEHTHFALIPYIL
jgi:hypothetical protein